MRNQREATTKNSDRRYDERERFSDRKNLCPTSRKIFDGRARKIFYVLLQNYLRVGQSHVALFSAPILNAFDIGQYGVHDDAALVERSELLLIVMLMLKRASRY